MRRASSGVSRLLLLSWPHRLRSKYGSEMLRLVGDMYGTRLGPRRTWALLQLVAEGLSARVAEPPRHPRQITESFMDRLRQDIGFALAGARRRPGFTASVVLTIALGVGANAVIFALLNAALIRPLDIPDADRVVQVFETDSERGGQSNVSFLNALDLASGADSIETLGVMTPVDRTIAHAEHPERLRGALVTAPWFEVLGTRAVRGRLLGPADSAEDGVMVVSERFWRSRLGADDSLIGATLRIDGVPRVVVGVATDPPVFGPFDMYQPLPRVDYVENRTNHFLTSIARLRAGRTMERAQSEATETGARLQAAYPATNATWNFALLDLQSSLMGATGAVLTLFLLVALGVLAVACANVTNLMLVRSAEREREIAVRAALGASSSRVLRQLLTESLVYAVIGGVVGIGLAQVGLGALRASIPADVQGLARAALDPTVVLFIIALTTTTGLLFGMAPAWSTSRRQPTTGLKSGAGASRGRENSRLRGGLVVTEVGIAVVLLVLAGTFLQVLATAYRVDPGFDPEGVTTLRLEPPANHYSRDELPQLAEQLLAEVRAVPGVEKAGLTTRFPLGRSSTMRGYKRAGDPDPDRSQATYATWTSIAPEYFDTLQLRLEHGREFDADDSLAGEPVVVVNEAMAREVFGTTDAVGEQLHVWTDESTPRTVVGVVADARTATLFDVDVAPEYYTPFAQAPLSRLSLVIRARGDDGATVPAIRDAILRVDPLLPVFDVRTMREVLDDEIATPRTVTALLAALATAALSLALFGLYGVVAYAASCRSHEIGVRMALGANSKSVRRLVVSHGLRLAAIGTLLGLTIAVISMRFAESQLGELFGAISTTGPGLATVVVALAMAGLASYLPARRAVRIDPLRALQDN